MGTTRLSGMEIGLGDRVELALRGENHVPGPARRGLRTQSRPFSSGVLAPAKRA
jgi:hypothetical protein